MFLNAQLKGGDSNLNSLAVHDSYGRGQLFKPHVLWCYYIRPLTYLRVPKTPSEHLILDGIRWKRWESGPDKKAQVQAKVANVVLFFVVFWSISSNYFSAIAMLKHLFCTRCQFPVGWWTLLWRGREASAASRFERAQHFPTYEQSRNGSSGYTSHMSQKHWEERMAGTWGTARAQARLAALPFSQNRGSAHDC